MPIIKLNDVNLYYDRGKPSEVWALRNVNLEINQGDYVAFFGPSGCGKTTMLYTISGMEIGKVSSGEILINGRDISKFTSKELAVFRQIGIGIVFQQFNLIPSINIVDNVALPMAFLGISLERRQKEAMKLLQRLGIDHLANRLPSELSGGQQQRVGIARALANNPPIVICDEPLGNLDSENANKVLEFLRELNEKDKRTVIMVTHEAWSLRDAKKIFYMKDGEILKVEQPKEKKAIAKSVSFYLYQELYPNLSQSEIIAKSLAQLFLRGYSVDEAKRFEFFLTQRLNGKIDEDIFRQVLDRSYKEGGVGLWKARANKISKTIEEFIDNKREIAEILSELEKNPEAPLLDEINRIRNWLLEEYKGKINEVQQIRLDEIISERIRNIINPDHFKVIINLSQNKFGIGLSMRASQVMSEKLEAILSKSEAVDLASVSKL